MPPIFKDLPFILCPFISLSLIPSRTKHLEDVIFSCLIISPSPSTHSCEPSAPANSLWQLSQASWDPTTSQDPKTSLRLYLLSAFRSMSWPRHSFWNSSSESKHHCLPLWFSDHSFLGSFAVPLRSGYPVFFLQPSPLFIYHLLCLGHLICLYDINSSLYTNGFQNCLHPI